MTLSRRFELAAREQKNGICSRCGETDPLAMTKRGLCYRCHCEISGRPTVERHHVFGKANDPATVIELDVNLHRSLSARRESWDSELQANRDGNPLIALAQLFQVIADFAMTIASRAERAADWLRWLAGYLAEVLEPDWYRNSEVLPWNG